ncbi:5-oxoprolinase subunit PxpB [Solibacillus sp. FSL W7-1464]|uniref:5-oxoprolinase subunit PxpB n=1 Tax=Solibacillus sp. FSL W7-1464 TaxID=2921706 RepID=UPI0030F89F75
MPALQFKQLSDQALLVQFGTTINEQTHQQIQQAIAILQEHPFPGLIEIVPSYTNFCVYYDPFTVRKSLQQKHTTTSAEIVQHYIKILLEHQLQEAPHESRLIEIPVLYGGEYGPDLNEVANINGLTPEEVIAIHTSKEYLVHMLGFAPGFPFLGGMDKRIATPRRAAPRLEISAGSVGIAGEQTGIYPLSTPGGWQIIGRTMIPLFLPDQNPPTLLRAGDHIRFVAVKEDTTC